MLRSVSLLILVGCVASYSNNHYGDKGVHIRVQSADEWRHVERILSHYLLPEDIDIWRFPNGEGDAFLRLPRDFYDVISSEFDSAGYNYDVISHDVGSLLDSLDEQITSWKRDSQHKVVGTYARYDDILEWYDNMTATYPQFISTQDIGVTYEGRPERLLKLSTGGTGKWAIFVEGGMHAREWISPATVIYITDQLIQGYVNNAEWINDYDFYILAVGNPDGYEFCWTDERLWRKNRNPNAGSSCIGTDLNRNWAFQWGGVGGDPDPCSNTYRGEAAESELEIQNVVNFIMPQADQFILYMAYHSWGQQFFTRWDYTEDDVPLDHDELEDLAWRAADAITAVNGVYHEAGRAPVIMYAFSGSSADWARGVPDIKYPFLEELRDNGTYSFVLPPEQIIPTGEENWAGFQVLLNEIQLKCEGVLPPGPCNL